MEKLVATIRQNTISGSLARNKIFGSLGERINVVAVTNHNELSNLDFEHSGHIGFASEARLNAIEQATVPKRLDALKTMDSKQDRKKAYLYVDNNGESEKISIAQALSTLIRTDVKQPDDMQVGEYLFLKKEN